YFFLGEIETQQAKWDQKRGRDPNASWMMAESFFQQTLKNKRDDSDAFEQITDLHRLRALRMQHLGDSGERILQEIKAGIESADRALQLNPIAFGSLAEKGEILRMQSQISNDPQLKAQGEQALNRAFAQNPLLRSKFL